MGVFQNNLMGAAAAAASAGGGGFYSHQIANSCRFNADATVANSSYLTRTVGTVDSNVHWTLNFWIKRSAIGGTRPSGAVRPLDIFTPRSGTSATVLNEFKFSDPAAGGTAGDALMIVDTNSNAIVLSSDNVFRDTSAWYNIHIQADLDNGTNSERLKYFINGTEASYNTDNRGSYTSLPGLVAGAWTIGEYYAINGYPIQSYLAQWCYIDGTTYAASDFGETKNGVWIPKDPSGLTFGSEGFYLKFESSSDLGNDSSGNNNDWTSVNLGTHDQMLDSPTFNSDSNGGNFCTGNPLLYNPNTVWSEGNLKITTSANNMGTMCNWQVPLTGKWYWEVLYDDQYNPDTAAYVGVMPADVDLTNRAPINAEGLQYYSYNGNKVFEGTLSAYGATWADDDIISVAVDRDGDTIQFYKNGAGQGTIDISGLAKDEFFPYFGVTGVVGQQGSFFNFGQEGTFGGAITAGGYADVTGYGNFKYDPGDFKALCTGNLPIAEEIDPAQTDTGYPKLQFSPLIYTGTGSSNARTGLGFQPDLVWIKERGGINVSKLTDAIRGVTKAISTNDGAVQSTDTNGLTAFGSDGFTVGSDVIYNNNTDTYASWNWKANGSGSSNSDGGTTSTVSANTDIGFSIVQYAGAGGTQTMGHGLEKAPELMHCKPTAGYAYQWVTYSKNGNNGAAGENGYLSVQYTGGWNSLSTIWGNTAPTSTVFTTGGSQNTGAGGGTYINYCWHSVEGVTKVGQYVGNGDVNGSFVYCGFRPSFVMCKNVGATGEWYMYDDQRIGYNVDNNSLSSSSTAAELTADDIDILSNGFKLRIATGPNLANNFIFLAMAENPFKYATAR